jgi:hypothetical protein
MFMYVVYWNPEDHPLKWVLRRWQVLPSPTPDARCYVLDTLEEARALIPRSMVRIERSPNDDPAIHEVWT